MIVTLITIHISPQMSYFRVFGFYSVLLGAGVLLLWDVADQLEGERSSTRVFLHRPDAPTVGGGQRNAALCILGREKQKMRIN